MVNFKIAVAIVLVSSTVSCTTSGPSAGSERARMRSENVRLQPGPMDPERKIAEQDCSKPVDLNRGNLRCK